MAVLNLKSREIECKVVYYGPGRCGKTTNLEYTYKTYKKQITGDMVSINTEGDRTLFFDFLPMGLGKIKGCDVRVQLYTVPGQVKYSSTRKLVLKGVDGVVFVADAMEDVKDAAGGLREARLRAAEGAWENTQDAIKDISGDATLGEAAATIRGQAVILATEIDKITNISCGRR